MFGHIGIDPETLCYLDSDSDWACAVGPNPTPGSVGAVTALPTVYAVTIVDTVTAVSAVAARVPIPTRPLNTSLREENQACGIQTRRVGFKPGVLDSSRESWIQTRRVGFKPGVWDSHGAFEYVS